MVLSTFRSFLRTLLGVGSPRPTSSSSRLDVNPSPGPQPRESLLERPTWLDLEQLEMLPYELGRFIKMRASLQREWATRFEGRISECSSRDLLKLDETARQWNNSHSGQTIWWQLSKQDLAAVERLSSDGQPHLLGLASFHRNGHVREEALRRMPLVSEALPFLLLRLNDWVGPVQTLARARLEALLARGLAPETVARHLSLILRLPHVERRDLRDTYQQLMAVLTSPENPSLLESCLVSSDLAVRRACWQVALNTPWVPMERFQEQVHRDPDPVIRMWIYAALVRKVPGSSLDGVLKAAFSDPFPPVRREALSLLREQSSQDGLTWLKLACLDRNRSVRDLARWHLKQAQPQAAAQLYLDRLDDAKPATRAIAIMGVAELNLREAMERILPYVDAPEVRVAKAALEALDRLQPSLDTDLFLHALRSAEPGVSRMAADILIRRPGSVSRDQVLEIYHQATAPHIKRQALRLLPQLPKWQAMEVILQILQAEPKMEAELAKPIERWLIGMNRMAPPRGAELERARAVLLQAREALGRPIWPELNPLLDLPWH